MFEKTLSDLVKGIRSNKRRESEFIAKCIAEIKEELSGKDKSQQVKANAVLKLTYLQMLGHDMSWASFHMVEVMSFPSFAHKRLGYLGASVSFNDETEVVLLCTNMFKKDFSSANPYEVGLSINCLANICTTDLARDLVADVVTLMNSNRAYVRKKAVLVMYKIFLKFPDALRPSFPKLKEKLEDRDTSAVSCAVNVICELARKNPQNYLALAPLFFKLLTLTANNWMLIKIVKLLGALCPLEPRLGKKLVEPLTNIINTTPAKSLLYECIHTVSVGMTPHLPIVQLSMDKLKGFVEDEDQNLKYLGLLAMGNFMRVWHLCPFPPILILFASTPSQYPRDLHMPLTSFVTGHPTSRLPMITMVVIMLAGSGSPARGGGAQVDDPQVPQ
jgi:AP-3 complex subunit delta